MPKASATNRRTALPWLRRESRRYAKHAASDLGELTELLVAVAALDELPLSHDEIEKAARIALDEVNPGPSPAPPIGSDDEVGHDDEDPRSPVPTSTESTSTDTTIDAVRDLIKQSMELYPSDGRERRARKVVAMARGAVDPEPTFELVLELLEEKLGPEETQPPGPDEDPLPALEAALTLLGSSQEGDRWSCPAHTEHRGRSLSISRGQDRLLVHCFGGCSFQKVLAALGWTKHDLYYHRGTTAPFVVDMFGHVHWAVTAETLDPLAETLDPLAMGCSETLDPIAETPDSLAAEEEGVLLSEGVTGVKASSKERKTHESGTASSSAASLASQLRNGEIPINTGSRPSVVELERRELSPNMELQYGPLPKNSTPEHLAIQRALADDMLYCLRLYAAAGEYRALLYSGSHAARRMKLLGVKVCTTKIADHLVELVKAGTFGRQTLGRHSVRRGTYSYWLLASERAVVGPAPEVPAVGREPVLEPVLEVDQESVVHETESIRQNLGVITARDAALAGRDDASTNALREIHRPGSYRGLYTYATLSDGDDDEDDDVSTWDARAESSKG